MRACIGDGRGGLRREQHQHLLVPVIERVPALLFREEEISDMNAAVTHRRALKVLRRHQVRGEAQRAHVGRQIVQSQHALKIPEMLEQTWPVLPLLELPALRGRESRGHEILHPGGLVDGGDDAVACTRQCPGAVHDLLKNRADVQAAVDAQDRRAQPGRAIVHRLRLRQMSSAVCQLR